MQEITGTGVCLDSQVLPDLYIKISNKNKPIINFNPNVSFWK